MIEALALASVMVHQGDTLSGIASAHGQSLASVEADNPQISDPNMIFVGQTVHLSGGSQQATVHLGEHEPDGDSDDGTPSAVHVLQHQNAVANSGSGGSVGMTGGSFQQCVIQRESGGSPQVMNSSGHYGLYQFDLPTWISGGGSAASFGHASVSEQNAVFNSVFAARGTQPWAPYDGC